MEAVLEALKRLDWSPLYISIRTGIVATIISFFLGIFAARKVLKASDKVRAAADGILTMPLVLPPTVAGFFLLLFFSRRRPLGILPVLAGLHHCGDRDRVSADVPKREGSLRTDRRQPGICRENSRNV